MTAVCICYNIFASHYLFCSSLFCYTLHISLMHVFSSTMNESNVHISHKPKKFQWSGSFHRIIRSILSTFLHASCCCIQNAWKKEWKKKSSSFFLQSRLWLYCNCCIHIGAVLVSVKLKTISSYSMLSTSFSIPYNFNYIKFVSVCVSSFRLNLIV